MIVYLTGYRATGKTTVASLLSERLGWRFLDTDAEIQQQAGQSVRSIFQDAGEEAFRDLESQVIAQLMREHKLVVSLGGGAVLRESNRKAISASGLAIWLTASPETICARLASDPATLAQRPSLSGCADDDPRKEVRDLLAVRIPLYESLADYTFATDDRTPVQIVDSILTDVELIG